VGEKENALTRGSLQTTCQKDGAALFRKWLCLFTPRTTLLTSDYLTSFIHPGILSFYEIPPRGTQIQIRLDHWINLNSFKWRQTWLISKGSIKTFILQKYPNM